MGPPLDEESFLLGVDDLPDENEENLVATENQASFRRTTVGLLAAVTSLVVVGTVASKSFQIPFFSVWTKVCSSYRRKSIRWIL